jgi:hypothetical protein
VNDRQEPVRELTRFNVLVVGPPVNQLPESAILDLLDELCGLASALPRLCGTPTATVEFRLVDDRNRQRLHRANTNRLKRSLTDLLEQRALEVILFWMRETLGNDGTASDDVTAGVHATLHQRRQPESCTNVELFFSSAQSGDASTIESAIWSLLKTAATRLQARAGYMFDPTWSPLCDPYLASLGRAAAARSWRYIDRLQGYSPIAIIPPLALETLGGWHRVAREAPVAAVEPLLYADDRMGAIARLVNVFRPDRTELEAWRDYLLPVLPSDDTFLDDLQDGGIEEARRSTWLVET